MKKFVYITISDSRSQDSNISDGAGLKITEILEKQIKTRKPEKTKQK